MNLPQRKQESINQSANPALNDAANANVNLQQATNDDHHSLTSPPNQPPGNYSGDTTSTSSNPIKYQVEFEGKGSEYFKIWIVNILLTIVTLYIFSAWAKVRSKRYFYGNTTINRSSFEYHATGKQLLIGKLVAAVLIITSVVVQNIYPPAALAIWALLALSFPWLLWRSMKFNAKVSSFRNVRFGFDGKARTSYWIMLALPLILIALIGGAMAAAIFLTADTEQSVLVVTAMTIIPFVAFMAVAPWIHKLLISYSHNSHRYGTSGFQADIRKRNIFWIHLSSTLLYLALLGAIIGLVVVVANIVGEDSLQDLFAANVESDFSVTQMVAMGGFYAALVLVGSLIGAYFAASIRNYRYNQTTIGKRVSVESSVGTLPLWWLSISNMMLLVITVGFAYPWTKVRSAKFFARNTTVTVAGGMDAFADQEQSKMSALGAEVADGFDVDFDLGV